jgi:hypothetical protein
VADVEDMKTRRLFETCLGKVFRIEALEDVDGLPYQMVELHVGHMVGREPNTEAIWIEPDYLEAARPPVERDRLELK